MARSRSGKLSDFSTEEQSRMRDQLGLMKVVEAFGRPNIFWCVPCGKYIEKIRYSEDYYTDSLVFRLECHNRIANYDITRRSMMDRVQSYPKIHVFGDDNKRTEIPKRPATAEELIVSRLSQISRETGASLDTLSQAFELILETGVRASEAFHELRRAFVSPDFSRASVSPSVSRPDPPHHTEAWSRQILNDAQRSTFLGDPRLRGNEEPVSIVEGRSETPTKKEYKKKEGKKKSEELEFYEPKGRKPRKLDL